MDILRFWGKARPSDPERGPRWHPLAYHSLDVAAVGEVLLTSRRGLGACFSRLLDVPRESVAPLVCYLLALHDVGKFARKFQAKAPIHYPDCFDDDPASLAAYYDHGAGGLRLFDVAAEAFKLPGCARSHRWRPLISAVTGHHGAPPEPQAGDSMTTLRGTDFGSAGIEAAHEFIRRAHDLLAPPNDIPAIAPVRVKTASFAVAGLAVLADWIGSNQEWFPYAKPDQSLESYWNGARERARRAVSDAGVLPAPANDDLDYRELIGESVEPSPMQKWARDVELPAGPALFMIEDETGSGKTEAALSVPRPRGDEPRLNEHLHVVVKMRHEPIEEDATEREASAPVRARIERAREAQMQRWGALNQDVVADKLRAGPVLAEDAAQLLDTARSKRHLSERRAETVLRIARTIADLAPSEHVEAVHVAEALGLQCAALDGPCTTRRGENDSDRA